MRKIHKGELEWEDIEQETEYNAQIIPQNPQVNEPQKLFKEVNISSTLYQNILGKNQSAQENKKNLNILQMNSNQPLLKNQGVTQLQSNHQKNSTQSAKWANPLQLRRIQQKQSQQANFQTKHTTLNKEFSFNNPLENNVQLNQIQGQNETKRDNQKTTQNNEFIEIEDHNQEDQVIGEEYLLEMLQNERQLLNPQPLDEWEQQMAMDFQEIDFGKKIKKLQSEK